MTNKDAIENLELQKEGLEPFSDKDGTKETIEAIDKAIESLSEDTFQWNRYPDTVPKKLGKYIICIESGFVGAANLVYHSRTGYRFDTDNDKIVAWGEMPALPSWFQDREIVAKEKEIAALEKKITVLKQEISKIKNGRIQEL